MVTRHNVGQLDEFAALADRYGATLRITRLRPSGRGADVWDELHPTSAQQVQLYDWLVAKGEGVLTGDSFFHLSPLGQSGALAGLNMCGAGRVVCLIDPLGDVYACPFAIHDRFFTGLPLDGPDPECVQGYGAPALAGDRDKPRPRADHSRTGSVPLTLSAGPPRAPAVAPARPCSESPV